METYLYPKVRIHNYYDAWSSSWDSSLTYININSAEFYLKILHNGLPVRKLRDTRTIQHKIRANTELLYCKAYGRSNKQEQASITSSETVLGECSAVIRSAHGMLILESNTEF